MSENGHKHGEYDAPVDEFVINTTNIKSVQFKTDPVEQPPVITTSNKESSEVKSVQFETDPVEQPPVIKTSNIESSETSNKGIFETEFVVKSVPLYDDDPDVYCTSCDYAWRPIPSCIAFSCLLIMLIIFTPLAVLRPIQSMHESNAIVPTVAPIESVSIRNEMPIYAPSEMPSFEETDIPTDATTTVPIAAPVAMPALPTSPTESVVDPVDITDEPTSVSTLPITKIGLDTLPPIDTDMHTSSSPTPSPTAFPTEPSFTLALSGDVISDAAPPGSQFGYTLSLSHNGTILSVGAPNYEEKGMVRAYTLSSNQWQQLGPDFYGDEKHDRYGWTTPLSANGLIMATSGGLSGGDTVPYVRVYNNVSPDGWSPRGSEITGNFGFGNSVSLSADGGRIAVGAKNIVNVFEYDEESDKWDLIGVMKEKYASLALSENGDVLAVGGPYSNDVYQEGGLVKVWEYEGGESWLLRGGAAAMYGHDAMEQCGYSVAISNDGGVVAAGSLKGNYVKVSRFSDGSWMPYGEDIQGEEDDNKKFGFKVALSGDAERLVVGSPLYMNYNGRSVVYNFNNKEQTWDNVMDVVGTNRNDQEGYAVAMSSDGSSIASSAMSANNGAGRVRVFNLQ